MEHIRSVACENELRIRLSLRHASCQNSADGMHEYRLFCTPTAPVGNSNYSILLARVLCDHLRAQPNTYDRFLSLLGTISNFYSLGSKKGARAERPSQN